MNPNNPLQPEAAPWWTFGYVWLVIAGPAAVVVASIATVWLTLAFPETLVAEDYYRQGLEINKTLAAQRAKALTPAMRGRDHAASPAGEPAR
ncbi:MAG: nitrogen fixation protein FixH [Ramlibacter sp.]|nr:nitrogen fixation protein FixH [Ramlibacter sp.]